MTVLNFNREIPVLYEVDVCVAGGGPAGLAAAVTAARNNLSVFLGEAHSCFGGMGTAGLVPAFMTISDGERSVIAGFGQYFIEKLWSAHGTLAPQSLNIKVEVLKRLCDEVIAKSGAQYLLHTTLIGVEKQGDRVTHAVFQNKSGIFAVAAKFFVDATGDGDLAVQAGAQYQLGDSGEAPMPGTLCSLWCNVDWARYHNAGKAARDYLPAAVTDGVFKTPDPHHPGMWQVSENITGGNFGHIFGLNSTDAQSLTAGLIEGRRQMVEFTEFYRRYVPGFEHCQLVSTGSLLGVRESRRIAGEYELNLIDFEQRASFPDEIGRYCYGVDIHVSRPDPVAYQAFMKNFTKLRMKKGESYGIPLRALVVKNLANVLCAGRCISTDRYLQSSVRVMPGCFITGQGAALGILTALREHCALREIAPEALQKTRQQVVGNYSVF